MTHKKNHVDAELIDKTEIELNKISQKDAKPHEEGVPFYKEDKLEYDETTIKRLGEEIFKKWENLKTQRSNKEDGWESKWDNADAQYKGEMADVVGLEFNLSMPVTSVKVDAVVRLATKAFTESDPKFTITARPTTAKRDQWDVTIERQTDYLDYKLDEEIDVESPLRKVLHQSGLYDVGIMKIPYEYRRKRRKREERYSGKVSIDANEQETQPGLNLFLSQYPDAAIEGNEGHWAYKDLLAKKDVVLDADFWQTVYNDPKPCLVDIRNFWVDKGTEGYEGLCNAQLKVEKLNYSWWELKHMEKDGDLENVDSVKFKANDAKPGEQPSDPETVPDYRDQHYDIIAATYWFDEKDTRDANNEPDGELDNEARIVCYFGVESKQFMGGFYYPYTLVDSVYVPFYIKNKIAGFYKGGIAEDLTDSNLAQNALLNFMLTEAWNQLQTTPIVREGSTVANQFLEKRWKPGLPITVDQQVPDVGQSVGFLQKPNTNVAQQMMSVLLFLGKTDDDRTGVSSLASGKETPLDPRAPAAKVAMLLRQSGINIEDYIKALLPSFNKMAEIILALTFQMSEPGTTRMYRQKQTQQKVVGADIFATIKRDEMIARTNIQSRAASFDFDTLNQKRENLALYQLLRSDPIVSRNPEGVLHMARTLAKSWSPLWKHKVDFILPTQEEFTQQQLVIGAQALALYIQQLESQAAATGQQQDPKFQEYLGIATKMMAEAVTPTEEKKK